MQQSNPPELTQDEPEISLLDILNLVKKSWNIIVGFGVLGLVGAVGYLVVTPSMYEATAQIRMAQISQTNPANPFGATIEDPNSLIARMQFPTNYSAQVISACDYQDKPQAALTLSKAVKLSIPKGVANTVELRVLAPSAQTAENCARAIFMQVAGLQEQLSKIFVEEAKTKLASDDERIEAAKKLIAKADQSGGAMSAAYLSARDELTYFLTDREKMTDLINSVKNRGTNLVSPIYISERPVTPKKPASLLAGLLGGLLIGLLLALWLQAVRKFKGQSKEVL